jgi:hypothetical protein
VINLLLFNLYFSDVLFSLSVRVRANVCVCIYMCVSFALPQTKHKGTSLLKQTSFPATLFNTGQCRTRPVSNSPLFYSHIATLLMLAALPSLPSLHIIFALLLPPPFPAPSYYLHTLLISWMRSSHGGLVRDS